MDDIRLGHDLVKIQWDEFDSEEEDEEEGVSEKRRQVLIKDVPIARTARELVSAAELAGTTPILVLPFLSRVNEYGLLDYLDTLGLRYHCKSDTYPIVDYAPGIPTSTSPNLPPRRHLRRQCLRARRQGHGHPGARTQAQRCTTGIGDQHPSQRKCVIRCRSTTAGSIPFLQFWRDCHVVVLRDPPLTFLFHQYLE